MENTKSWIPKIKDDVLEKLFKKIKPIVRKGGEAYYIEKVDLRGASYLWSPKTTRKAPKLEPITDIRTYHTYGYYGFFKPSIAEVIAQIPKEYLSQVTTFEIISSPEDANDLGREQEALNAGYHVAITRLYKKIPTKRVIKDG